MFRFFGFLFALGTLVFIVSVGAISGLLYHFSKDLPDYSQLQDYEPPVMTRVHAADGELLAEYAKQRRLYLPIQAVPKLVINAFISAEDKNFYDHPGIDFSGIARAGVLYLQNLGKGRRPQGASTITQQVAKNFLLTNEVSFDRKIKEALLALKIERTYSKEKILELYLNEIYLGFSAYGVAAASLLYFDKSVNELTIAEASYLAALPKAPTDLHPFRNRERAIERRNYVIERLVENGYITADAGDKAKKEPLAVTQRATGAHIFAADYFAEDVRREILEKYGEKRLYEGGLSVRTTLDPKMQVMAHKALSDGLVRFDEGRGFRGPVSKIDIGGDWGVKLADVRAFADIAWRLAVVLETSDQSARIGLQPAREPGGAVVRDRQIGIIPIEGAKWARASSAKQPLRLGSGGFPGRRGLCGSARPRQGRPVQAAPDSRSVRRHGGDGSAHRPRARAGRRLLVRPEPVRPRHPGDAPARLRLQAVRLFGRDRQRLYAVDHRDGRPHRDRPGARHRHLAPGKLRDASSSGRRRCASASSIPATS